MENEFGVKPRQIFYQTKRIGRLIARYYLVLGCLVKKQCNVGPPLLIGIKINKSMQVAHGILVNGQALEKTRQFKYIISDNGKLTNYLKASLHNARKIIQLRSKFLRTKEVSETTKLIVYKSIYTPVLTNDSETWAITNKVESKIRTAGMRYIRAITGKTT